MSTHKVLLGLGCGLSNPISFLPYPRFLFLAIRCVSTANLVEKGYRGDRRQFEGVARLIKILKFLSHELAYSIRIHLGSKAVFLNTNNFDTFII